MSASPETSNGKTPVDKLRIEAAMREVLSAIGEDPNREGLRDTPRRIADVYEEILGGMRIEAATLLKVGFEEAYDEMVILRDIPFFSMCEHHLLPFHGVVHVSYIPNGRVVGDQQDRASRRRDRPAAPVTRATDLRDRRHLDARGRAAGCRSGM